MEVTGAPDAVRLADRTTWVGLVFQGGGVKGVALRGAFAVLEECGYQPQSIAGNSRTRSRPR